MARRKWTAGEVVEAIRHQYGLAGSNLVQDEWSMFTEVPLRTGKGYWGANERRIDALLVRNWGGGKQGHERIAIEVKVSKSDYRNEHDLKRAPAEQSAHRCFYATPPGLIAVEDLHPGWGLMEVNERTGGLDVVRRAERRTPDCDMEYLVSAVARCGSRAIERIRRGEDDVAKVPTLQAEVERLSAMLYRRDQAITRERARARAAKTELLMLEGTQECADCHLPLTWSLREVGFSGHWTHVDKAQDRICEEARRQAARAAQEARTGARYLAGYAGPIEPVAVRAMWAEAETDGEAVGG